MHTIYVYASTDGDCGYYNPVGFSRQEDALKYKKEKRDAWGVVFPLKVNEFVISLTRQRQLWRKAGKCMDCGGDCRMNPHTKQPFARCPDHLIEQAARSNKYYHATTKKRRMNVHQEAHKRKSQAPHRR